MIERMVLPWSSFKGLVDLKNPAYQFVEDAKSYSIWFDEGHERYYCAVAKSDPADADQTDWETNYKSQANFAIGNRPYAFATGDFDFKPKAAKDVCPAGQTKSIYFACAGNEYMNGGKLITDGNAVFGDHVTAHVVDKDNLLGQGVDYVLKEWIADESWYVDYHARSEIIQTPYAGLPPAGMYFRFQYHSVGASDVGFAVNIFFHKAI